MKTQFVRLGRSVTALVLAAVLPGCVDGSEQPTANNGDKAVAKPIDKRPEKDSPSDEKAPAPESDASVEAPLKLELALPKLSPGLPEVIRLAQAQVGESVLLAYINKSAFAFNPSLEEILYLHDVGISEPVLTAILNRSQQQAGVTAKLAQAQPAMANNKTVGKAEIPALDPLPSITAPSPEAEPVATPVGAQIVVQPAVYSQPVVISQPVFYNDLAPYGTWIEIGGYGRCWQPTAAVVDLSWRPYHHRGRWLDTDAGWYWQSDYSWGWAPFHYGRWHQDRSCGWVWVPGNTWAPAWVSWRYSNNYCGWAPLPPTAGYGLGAGFIYNHSRVGVNFEFGLASSHYTFVPIDRFCDRTPYRHYVPRTQVAAIYNQTTVVNNYVTGNNNTIINHGVDHRAVTAAARTEIQKVSIRDATTENARHIQPDRLVREGNSVAIFRPQMASLTPSSTAATTARIGRGTPEQPPRQRNGNHADNPDNATSRRDGGATKPEAVSSLSPPVAREPDARREFSKPSAGETRARESRALTVPSSIPNTPAALSGANTQPTTQRPQIVPLLSPTPRTPTLPHSGGSTTPQAPFNFQAPKPTSPTTQPQPATASAVAPTTVTAPAAATSPTSRPNSNRPEHFSRPEIQRSAPQVRSTFQPPAPPSPTPQPQAPAPRAFVSPPVIFNPAPPVPQPSRPQYNPPAPVPQPQPPTRPAAVAQPPPSPAPNRPQSAPPPQRNGEERQNRPDKRNP